MLCMETMKAKVRACIHVIVVPWVSRVYGICTLRAVICISKGAAGGNTYNCTKSANPYTLETHAWYR